MAVADRDELWEVKCQCIYDAPRATRALEDQLACSIARVAGCLHTDVSSPWLTHGWSDLVGSPAPDKGH